MSSGPLDRSPDLQRLLTDGFDIEIRSGFLLVHDVPYVKPDRTVGLGTLVSTLNLAGDRTAPPETHAAFWVGEFPCDATGHQMDLGSPGSGREIDSGLRAGHTFSRKPEPESAYADYWQKVTTYVAMIESQAQILDGSATARTRRPARPRGAESVFEYLDTASARAGIGPINSKLASGKIAIVGLGGTGSYVLDLVAKTPADEIHLFDGDFFLTHNAFRSPGAPTLDELDAMPKKATWFAARYSAMRKRIIPHAYDLGPENVAELRGMAFTFVCMDAGPNKSSVVAFLTEERVPYVDVGIGVVNTEGTLAGTVRVTRCTGQKQDHVARRIPLVGAAPDEYDENIQVADINSLNAALAVIRWKKERGFYSDFGFEQSMVYSIATNTIVNDEFEKEDPSPSP